MCQLPAPRALRVPLLMALALSWPVLAAAVDAGPEQDAGVPDAGAARDAGAEADAGMAPEATLLFPQIGATGVVTNPALLMRLEGVALDAKLYETLATFEGLILRDPGGNLVAVGPLQALQPRPDASLDFRVELSSATLELKANLRYEVLSRLAICDGAPSRTVCFEDEYHSLGTFETGTVADQQPPTISSISTKEDADPCLKWLSVVASDDLAPPGALRFVVAEQPFAWLGPTLSVQIGWRLLSSAQVVPVDPSGNRGAPVSTELGFCGPNSGYGSVTLPDGPASTPTSPASAPPRRHEHGCSLVSAAAATSSNVSVLALASLWLYRRRQRRS
jgi:hypothetical protein